MTDLFINARVSIPSDEITFQFSRSGGPGGQNVNRTATQVELRFDVEGSPSLTAEQKALMRHRLRSYIDTRGVLHLFSQATSSQMRNREEVLARFQHLVRESLHVQRVRIATRPSRGAKETRLESKRRRSLVKRTRRIGRGEW